VVFYGSPHTISMPLSFWIALGTSVAVLALSLLRMVRLREVQVLEKLVDPNVPPIVLQSEEQGDTDKRPNPQGEEKAPTAPATFRPPRGVDHRPGSRVRPPVPLLIEHVEPLIHSSREYILSRVEERPGELYSGSKRQNDLVRHRIDEIAPQLESLTAETSQARSHHEQELSGVRSLLVSPNTGVTQEHLDSLLSSSREQILSQLERRLDEVSGHYEQLLGEARNRADKLAEQVEKLSSETRDHLVEARSLADRASCELRPQDPFIIDQSLSHAKKEFETAAARVSDRELIRLMEQKRALFREVSLELEARTSEARALLQKSANSTLEEFRRSVELQIDLILAEAKERVTSSIASLDAESRTAVEARRRGLEIDVARAIEQSTMEFRSGIKAFLYSCFVAAVGAVDEHAQTTLEGLATDPGNLSRALDTTGGSSPRPDDPPAQPNNLSSSQ
jgi:hypothetical protein